MNISSCDSIVEEYLIHRGFIKTFYCIQKEKKEDITKEFNTIKIVEQIFLYLFKYEIESFINLWYKFFFISLICWLNKSENSFISLEFPLISI